uniref:Uncharacterized protein n=1 Tax=Romanomermis culicivorax TaxID=13658 RepID=A0A915IS22_ROMCU
MFTSSFIKQPKKSSSVSKSSLGPRPCNPRLDNFPPLSPLDFFPPPPPFDNKFEELENCELIEHSARSRATDLEEPAPSAKPSEKVPLDCKKNHIESFLTAGDTRLPANAKFGANFGFAKRLDAELVKPGRIFGVENSFVPGNVLRDGNVTMSRFQRSTACWILRVVRYSVIKYVSVGGRWIQSRQENDQEG